MDFAFSEHSLAMQAKLRNFMEDHVIPRHAQYMAEQGNGTYTLSFMDDLKALARSEGLWNMFLPALRDDEPGTRMSNLDYAPLAEIMGRLPWAPEVFNCSAPDTGNMEILHMFGTPEQKQKWLMPLLNGEIRSCFSMTEPDVASSDATNIETLIRRDGDEYVINGRKWFTTHAGEAAYTTVMVRTETDVPDHSAFSMIVVPTDTRGYNIVRDVKVMGKPDGHYEVLYDNVRVPKTNLLGPRGQGFKIAQDRLGPGRIFHCMRWLGQAQRAFDLMCRRANKRVAFGKTLGEHQQIQKFISDTATEIQASRLLTLHAAQKIDEGDEARIEIGLIKVYGATMLHNAIDRAIQVHGALGVTEDTPLETMYRHARGARILDGADEVHVMNSARRILRSYLDGGTFDFGLR